ncbi:hypothetical protein [Streptomyces cucumeris]|uniref:hypothetical protein n=1 Tax=Streptomyces cucumeris TaxID=2962890 RepID=UPI003D74AA26
MTAEVTAGYLAHHVKLAGRSDTLFSDDAIAMIHTTGRGLPPVVARSDVLLGHLLVVDHARPRDLRVAAGADAAALCGL